MERARKETQHEIRFLRQRIAELEGAGQTGVPEARLNPGRPQELEEFRGNPNPVLRVSLDGRPLAANAAGREVLARLDAGKDDQAAGAWRRLLTEAHEKGGYREREVDFRDKVLLVQVTPLPDASCLHVQAVDITRMRHDRERLQKKEAELREAQRIARLGSWHWNLETGALTGSDELYSIYGMDPARPFPSFEEQKDTILPEASWLQKKAAVEHALRTGLGYELELAALRLGAPIWVSTRSEVERGPGGRVVALHGTVQDITDRKRAELALQESEEKYKSALRNMSDVYYRTDEAGHIAMISPSAQRVLGYPDEAELLGQPLDSLWAYPARRQDMLAELLKTGSIVDYETVARKKDGSFIWVSVSSCIEKDGAGAVRKTEGVLRDITDRKLTEMNIKEHEAKLRLLAEHAPAAVAMLDRDLRYITVTRRWLEDFGKVGQDLRGHRHFEVFPEIPKRWREALARGLDGAVERGDEDPFVRADGRVQWIRWEVRPWYSASGEIGGLLIFSEDVTERKKSKDRIYRQNAILEGIGRILRDTVTSPTEAELGKTMLAVAKEVTGSTLGFIGEVNQDGRFKSFHVTDKGFKRCGMPGKAEYFRNPQRIHVKGLFSRILKEHQTLLMNDLDVSPTDVNLPSRHTPLMNLLGVPLFRSGQVAGLIVLANRKGGYTEEQQDILEALAPSVAEAFARKRAELAASESEHRFRVLANSMPQLAWITQPDGSVIWFNEQWYQYTGSTPEQMEGWGWQSAHDPEILPEVLRQWNQSLSTGEPFEMVFPLRGADGAFRPFLTRIVPIRAPQGHIIQWLGTSTDISDQKRMEKMLEEAKEAAEQANKAKSEFLASMSHEIRTPMNGILGFAQFLVESDINDKAKHYARIILQSGKSLLGIINDILDLSKIEAGKFEIEEAPFSLNAVLEGVLRPLETLAADKGLQLLYRVAPGVPDALSGDYGRLTQILTNLVGNAIKFTQAGQVLTTVTLAGRQTPSRVSLGFSVADEGIGIPRERLESIFEPFTQVGDTAHTKYGGTGLGLSICKNLVEMMGGRIWAQSKEGKGSTFSFEVEFDVADQAAKTEGPSRCLIGSNRKTLKILLAEDNTVSRFLALEFLRAQRHHEVVEAHDGREALDRLLKDGPFDLVLMDVSMPVMDGMELTRRIRNGETRDPAVPIVALTAHDIAGDRETFLAAGMDDYLAKPLDFNELDQLLERIVEHKETAG